MNTMKESGRNFTTTALLMFLVALVATPTSRLLAQQLPDLPYTSGSTGADGEPKFAVPFSPGRHGFQMVYDTVKNRTMLFGGSSAISALGDTWILEGSDWKRVDIPPSEAPAPRYYYGMCFDSKRRETVLFGGFAPPNGAQNDTWLWNGESWRKANPANSPPVGAEHTMAFDAAREQVVLLTQHRETWTWDGTDWTKRDVSGPNVGIVPAFAYDEERREVIAFSGDISGAETWRWNGSEWSRLNPTVSPPQRGYSRMVYDSVRKEMVMSGGWQRSGGRFPTDTWLWNGATWREVVPKNRPHHRYIAAGTFDATRQQVLLAGGNTGNTVLNDTWAWDGQDWVGVNGVTTLDVASKPNATWNFTRVNVPAGATVQFVNNPQNLPIRWLATGPVEINGTLDLDGKPGSWFATTRLEAPGGPGGYSGGLGGVIESLGGPVSGTAGQGPGGSLSEPDNNSLAASYASRYGNKYLQPLLGGSGGGGGYASGPNFGGRGSGGGGAILIASSDTITIGASGIVQANGGPGEGGGRNGGSGSGGGIRLIADRIAVKGTISATPDGRIRLEAYERDLTSAKLNESASIGAPVPAQPFDTAEALLRIVSIAGQNVAQPPKNDARNPDVIFSAAGEVVVSVQGEKLPAGSAVKLRLSAPGALIEKPAANEPKITLASGKADITLAVPKGAFTLQVFAELAPGP